MLSPRLVRFTTAALALAASAIAASATGTERKAVGARSINPRTARCAANVVHPISVRVTALDPIAHGATVRLRLTASSRVGLERVEARMLSAGGAANQGATVVPLGTLSPGRDAASVFTLAVPQAGSRFYVQFQVVGQGPQGALSRGACYNLLPDGPLETGRLVVTPQGARVMEVAARRIGP